MIFPMVELVVPMDGSVQLRLTLWDETSPADKETGTGGGALVPSPVTEIFTGAEVVDRPFASVAMAVMT